jgi:hypothetical protein
VTTTCPTDAIAEEDGWTREDAERAVDGADPTDPENYAGFQDIDIDVPDIEAPDIGLPDLPWWSKYAAAGAGVLVLLVVLRPYASMGATAAEVAG